MVGGMVPWWALPAAGAILGTTIVFLWLALRCRHGWELVDKTELPPAIEAFEKNNGYRNTSGWLAPDQAERMSRRTVILALRCPRCGAARIWETCA